VMAGKIVVVTAARLAWEGQPFVLFHILPVVPRGLRSPLSSFSELSFCFFQASYYIEGFSLVLP